MSGGPAHGSDGPDDAGERRAPGAGDLDEGAAHDVLAAEEFGVGVADPGLHPEAAHDVLAAEEFGVGVADPGLHPDAAHDVLAAEEFGVGSRASELQGPPAPRRRWRAAVAPAVAATLAALVWRRRRS